MAFKKNVVKVDLCSYPPYLFLAPKKFGKSTFWWKLVREAWGEDEKGLLISFGDEEGYHSLDGLQYERAVDWDEDYDEDTELRGFVQIIDDIVENNSEYGIKGVCLDTFDAMVKVATRQVLKLHKKEKGTICKSLNDALGGYGKGVERLNLIISEQVTRLRNLGIAVFVLCHTKMKECTDTLTGEKYEQLTNNLQSNIYNALSDTAQMVMVGGFDREINNGKIIKEDRVIYLRGSSTIDAGGRFTSMPDKIDLSAKAFLEAFEEAVKNSIKNKNVDLDKLKKEEDAKREEQAKIATEKDIKSREDTEETREEYLAIIKDRLTKSNDDIKTKAKELLASTGCPKFSSPEVPIETLKQIVDLF